jgi:prepilin-type N-terminal cleavage/methylation domain-containing protein
VGGERTSEAVSTGEAGFTVLELLIVLAIVAAVAIVVQVETSALRRRAVAAGCTHAVREIEASAELVRARTATYPPAADGTTTATPLLISTGTLARWPRATDYALAWNGSAVQVTDSRDHQTLGTGIGACRPLGH